MEPRRTELGQADLAGYVDQLQSLGRYSFTRTEATAALGCSAAALKQAARRLVLKQRLSVPRRGFFVIVPLEYRSAGAPPPPWFIDALMQYEEHEYYVGLLSAAALHGAAHQQPQEYQVVTDAPLRPAKAGRARLRFFTKRHLDRSATMRIKTETGSMAVSTPEVTAFDLVRYVHACGGLSNVATLLAELGERLDPLRLGDAARAGVEIPVAQRLGHLLDRLVTPALTDPLHEWTLAQTPRLARLRADLEGTDGDRDGRWLIVVNEEIEADI